MKTWNKFGFVNTVFWKNPIFQGQRSTVKVGHGRLSV